MENAVARCDVVLFGIDPLAGHIIVDGIACIEHGEVDVVRLPERVADVAQSGYFQCAGITVIIELVEVCALSGHSGHVGVFQDLVFVADTYRGKHAQTVSVGECPALASSQVTTEFG